MQFFLFSFYLILFVTTQVDRLNQASPPATPRQGAARGASACAARRLLGKSAFWSHVWCKNHIPPKYGNRALMTPFSLNSFSLTTWVVTPFQIIKAQMKNPTGSLNEPDGVICFIAQAANGLENILLYALQIRIGRETKFCAISQSDIFNPPCEHFLSTLSILFYSI